MLKWINIVVNSHNEKLLINKKEQAIDTCNYMDESQNNYAALKKADQWLYL